MTFAANATVRRTVNTRWGREVKHVPCRVIARDETWSTVELEDGSRIPVESYLVRLKQSE